LTQHWYHFDLAGVYISIIDTTKLTNIILHTPALCFVSQALPSYPIEYLAFGTISGPAHKAVPVASFLESGVERLCPAHATKDYFSWMIRRQGLEKYRGNFISDLSIAGDIGKLFGEGAFALVVAANVVTLRKRNEEEIARILQAFSVWDIPRDWITDSTIMTDDVAVDPCIEARRAILLLRKLVQSRYDDASDGRAREARLQKKLGFGILGWEWHAKLL